MVLGQLPHEGVLGPEDTHAECHGVQGGDGAGEAEHVTVERNDRSCL